MGFFGRNSFGWQNPLLVGQQVGSASIQSPGCAVLESASQSISNNTTTSVTFSIEAFDNGNMHSTSVNTSRITIVKDGVYIVVGRVSFVSSASGTYREVTLFKNGTSNIDIGDAAPSAAFATSIPIASVHKFVRGDYIELQVFQDTGSPLNINTSSPARFSAVWISN